MNPNLTPIEGVEDFDSAREKPTTGGVRDGEAFALDTSGSVQMTDWAAGSIPHRLYWSDLDPFTQGYVEALLTEMNERHWRDATTTSRAFAAQGFSDLAPETLGVALHDCALRSAGLTDLDAQDGRLFWAERQDGKWVAFPPQTVALSDAGKVVFL